MDIVKFCITELKSGVRWALNTFGVTRTAYYYKSKSNPVNDHLKQRISEIACKHITYGYKLIHQRLMQEDKISWNHKRIYRLYKELGLSQNKKSRVIKERHETKPLIQPLVPNLHWSMDFMHDRFGPGRKLRLLNVIDNFNREALLIHPAGSFTSNRVIQQLHQLIEWRGKPESIRVDNGPEFIAERLKSFCKYQHIELDFITPGKPTENALIERFNKTVRQEVLNINYFPTLIDAKKILEQWQYDYNNNRPHSGINNMTPTDFLLKYGKLHNPLLQAEFPTFQQEHNNYTFFY